MFFFFTQRCLRTFQTKLKATTTITKQKTDLVFLLCSIEFQNFCVHTFKGALTDLMREMENSTTDQTTTSKEEEIPVNNKPMEGVDTVTHSIIQSSDTITLKKSTFQGHACVVHTLGEVKSVLKTLKQNKKVSQATHNIVAYRLVGVNETSFIQDYADDGEVNAGGRLLHLLQIMGVKNVVVVVSRWYGGILLGPDRFRLINNVAREAVIQLGIYEPKQVSKQRPKKKKQH